MTMARRTCMRGGILLALLTVGGVHSIPVFSTIPALVPFPDSFPVTASIAGVDAQDHTTFIVLDPTMDTTVTRASRSRFPFPFNHLPSLRFLAFP
ncbi:hypothetical protein C8F01DRAFT_1150434 [Mycena amicta]|nr:hypothetical protein C8F01DRAFT_1150434 [Mycena amicta]